MIDGDGLIDMLQTFVESVVLMDGHASVIILVDLVQILKLLDLLVALLDVPAKVKVSHVSDHSYEVRFVLFFLELLLIRGYAVLVIPVLEFVLVSAHFVDKSA